jgi:hypothetical protein
MTCYGERWLHWRTMPTGNLCITDAKSLQDNHPYCNFSASPAL